MSRKFLIGAATAAHQVEGNNVNSDCWAMEQMEFTSYNEPSLDAVDHYNRYEEEIKLLAEAGLNAYRFSIEWARVDPEPGVFSEKEIRHYRDVLACCHASGVEPIVTMHHFSSPKWLIQQGGWWSLLSPACSATISRDFIPFNLCADGAQVKSVLCPCRFIASSFIL